MQKIDKHIEIVRPTDIKLSPMSLESCEAIFVMLSKHYTNVGITNVNNLADLRELVAKEPDLVFLGMKFVNSGIGGAKKVWLSEYLDDHAVAYTGSAQLAHEMERNKHQAKQRVLDAGLSTSPFFVVKQDNTQVYSNINLNFPLFVKPTDRGGGVGIDASSVVRNVEELNSKTQHISRSFDADSMVEEYLPGREFSVAILKDATTDELLAMPIELIAQPDKNGLRILSKQVKSSNTEQAVEVFDKELKTRVTDLALDVFNALGARDYGRIDIRLDSKGVPHFLEANLIPSLIAGYGSFPKACMLNEGIDYQQMILSIVRLGLLRTTDLVVQVASPNILDVILEPAV